MPKIPIYLFTDCSRCCLGILAFFLLVYLLGVIATNVLGRKLVHWGDRLFTTIPLVKNIYTSSKQLTDAFSATRKVHSARLSLLNSPGGAIHTRVYHQ